MIESDHRTHSAAAIERIKAERVSRQGLFSLGCSLSVCPCQSSGKARSDFAILDLPPAEFGRPKAEAGQWGSLIRVIDPLEVRLAVLDGGFTTSLTLTLIIAVRELDDHRSG